MEIGRLSPALKRRNNLLNPICIGGDFLGRCIMKKELHAIIKFDPLGESGDRSADPDPDLQLGVAPQFCTVQYQKLLESRSVLFADVGHLTA